MSKIELSGKSDCKRSSFLSLCITSEAFVLATCRIFKIYATTYYEASSKQPSYLHSLLTPVRTSIQLRSSSSYLVLFLEPTLILKLGLLSIVAQTLTSLMPGCYLCYLYMDYVVFISFCQTW